MVSDGYEFKNKLKVKVQENIVSFIIKLQSNVHHLMF